MLHLEHQRKFLLREGYLIVRSLFPRDEVAALIAEQNAFYRGEYDLTPPFIWPQIRSCQAKTRKHPCASFFCSGMAKLTRDGRLASQIKDNFNLPLAPRRITLAYLLRQKNGHRLDTARRFHPRNGAQPRRALAAHFASADLNYQKNGKFSHVNERIVRRIDGLPDFRDPKICPLV